MWGRIERLKFCIQKLELNLICGFPKKKEVYEALGQTDTIFQVPYSERAESYKPWPRSNT